MGKLLAAVLVVCFANGAVAKGPNDVCAKDRETLCGTVERGEGRVLKCMMDNKDKLSADCKAKFEKMKDHAAEMKDACHEDHEKFCANVSMGKGKKMKCMMEHKDELSADCKAQMENMKDAHKKMRKGK
ncbi:cysteine rich repeat-containing protein [Bdellovibrio bacteriovorus]|uniref:Uncharacterized protein n=1 Tax=Bdellovibrio bacteriovorus TaxID=959 RepID=A0A1Z3N921_BDEBC|nr:cysteine rich repeat-containing protein [Bdellovibrio bacteriovorus]ASD63946.1 hypothetical protein B9G79_10385 [Bdellovibrio bacteriovorus]